MKATALALAVLLAGCATVGTNGESVSAAIAVRSAGAPVRVQAPKLTDPQKAKLTPTSAQAHIAKREIWASFWKSSLNN
jgi:hypothetical protein